MLRSWFNLTLIFVFALFTCFRPKTETAQQVPPRAEPAQQARPPLPAQTNSHVVTLPTQAQKTTGDLDALLKGRTIQVVVPFSKTQFYVLKGVKRGLSYESGSAFEAYINRKYTPKTKHLRIHV